ncbi:hypothetical protein [Halalkalibacter okhensis]|uniref:Uncharacterized protein n=1 Tax=Halalkalibacter okhensis TaxID=333138 RepID=A0A0B0IH42_9BACI|nr:hypothetical protein [Halalkalibacter okhensis]KHF41888.1 hypothetical protein LQ50_00925 [Halalkalibacter okhensis]
MPLERLFDFIVQNFVFVAVVVGGIISMLGRMSGAGQQQQENRGTGQRQRQPQRQPQPQEEKVDWREIFKQEEVEPERVPARQESKMDQVTVPVEKELLQQELQDRYDELRQKREKTLKRGLETKSETEATNQSGGLDLRLNRLSNKEAMKAVVWSEVLGPPRGRQPHNTFSRKRYMK